MDRDDDLTRRFAELKRWDEGRTPPFDAVLRSRRPRPVRWVPLAAAAALVGLTLVLVPRLTSRPGERIRWLVDWQSPTTSLLTVPGADFNRMPSLSTSVIHMEEP